jgi:hypothetical protein
MALQLCSFEEIQGKYRTICLVLCIDEKKFKIHSDPDPATLSMYDILYIFIHPLGISFKIGKYVHNASICSTKIKYVPIPITSVSDPHPAFYLNTDSDPEPRFLIENP